MLDSLTERTLLKQDICLFYKTQTPSARGAAGGTNPISSVTLQFGSLPGHALCYSSSMSDPKFRSTGDRPRVDPFLDVEGAARPPRDEMPRPPASTCVMAVRFLGNVGIAASGSRRFWELAHHPSSARYVYYYDRMSCKSASVRA